MPVEKYQYLIFDLERKYLFNWYYTANDYGKALAFELVRLVVDIPSSEASKLNTYFQIIPPHLKFLFSEASHCENGGVSEISETEGATCDCTGTGYVGKACDGK